MFGPRRGPNISRAKYSRPKHLKCSHGYAFFACTPNVCTGKLFRQMFVRVGLCFYFFSPLHYAKGLDREATSLPGQTFEMFGPRVWTTCCKNVCTGRPFAVFWQLFQGISREKKASRPQPPARFDPRGFFSKKAYPYKHPKPDVCAARLFWATKWRGTNIRRRETARGSSAKGHGNGPEMVVSPLGCLGRAGRADPKRLTRTNIRPKSTRTNIRGARSEQKRGGIT